MTNRLVFVALALAYLSFAQRRVDPRNSYYRVIAVVPIIGSGTPTDPKRPEYAPWPASQGPNGIIGFYCEPTDDGKSVVVEFVAQSRMGFQALLGDKSITLFEKGRATSANINAVIQRVRRDFDIDKFGMVMP